MGKKISEQELFLFKVVEHAKNISYIKAHVQQNGVMNVRWTLKKQQVKEKYRRAEFEMGNREGGLFFIQIK